MEILIIFVSSQGYTEYSVNVADIVIFRRGKPITRPIEGVDNENLAFQRGLRLFWPLKGPNGCPMGPFPSPPPPPTPPQGLERESQTPQTRQACFESLLVRYCRPLSMAGGRPQAGFHGRRTAPGRSPPFFLILVEQVVWGGEGGGGIISKTKTYLKKELKTGGIKLTMILCC